MAPPSAADLAPLADLEHLQDTLQQKKRGDNVLLCRPQQWVMWLLFCSAVFPDVAVWSGPQAHYTSEGTLQ